MMIALEELISEARDGFAKFNSLAGIFIGQEDIERLKKQTVLTDSAHKFPYPNVGKIAGVSIYEDPGLPPGNYQVVIDQRVLDERLRLIKYGLTVTPDNTIKRSDWWHAARKL